MRTTGWLYTSITGISLLLLAGCGDLGTPTDVASDRAAGTLAPAAASANDLENDTAVASVVDTAAFAFATADGELVSVTGEIVTELAAGDYLLSDGLGTLIVRAIDSNGLPVALPVGEAVTVTGDVANGSSVLAARRVAAASGEVIRVTPGRRPPVGPAAANQPATTTNRNN